MSCKPSQHDAAEATGGRFIDLEEGWDRELKPKAIDPLKVSVMHLVLLNASITMCFLRQSWMKVSSRENSSVIKNIWTLIRE